MKDLRSVAATTILTDIYTVQPDGSIANDYYYYEGGIKHSRGVVWNSWEEFLMFESVHPGFTIKVRATPLHQALFTRVEEE